MTEPIKKYNSKGNLIYLKNSDGDEYWYDDMGKYIHSKSPCGYEEWYGYDNNGNCIYFKNSTGYEEWYEYDKHHYNFFYLDTNDGIIWRKYPIFVEYHNKILFR
jgi:hypothetical protein